MPTALDIALDYINRGWNPVPVNYRAKKPSAGNGWQLRIIDATNAPDYFNDGQMNIGVILGPSSHGLTDVDLDCDEARTVAPYILPRTGAIFGRASSRAAHRLYYTDLFVNADKAVLNFDDPTTAGRILELRIGGDSGAQTVFPGSIHEEGEAIAWEERGEPASVDGDDLARRVRDLAAGAGEKTAVTPFIVVGGASEQMGETKYNTSHHAGGTPEARIASRLRNSGDVKNSEHSVVHGTGPTRTYTNVHHSRVHEHGKPSPGEGDIHGNKRGVV